MQEELQVTVDTSDVDASTREAQLASERANMAAAAAAGATVAQAQLIGQVMEAGREDAQQAAIDAEVAARDAEQAATDAVTTNVAVMAQFQRLHDTFLERLTALEEQVSNIRRSNESAQEEEAEEEGGSDDVTEIQQEEVPGASTEGTGEDNVSDGNRRPVKGRARRRR